MHSRFYKIRRFTNGKSTAGKPFVNYSLTVPAAIVEDVPEGIQFTVEMTEEGILYRPTTVEEQPQVTPSWAKSGSQNGQPEKPAEAKPEKKSPRRKRPTRS